MDVVVLNAKFVGVVIAAVAVGAVGTVAVYQTTRHSPAPVASATPAASPLVSGAPSATPTAQPSPTAQAESDVDQIVRVCHEYSQAQFGHPNGYVTVKKIIGNYALADQVTGQTSYENYLIKQNGTWTVAAAGNGVGYPDLQQKGFPADVLRAFGYQF